MTTARLNNALLEILLHIGNSFDTKSIINEAFSSYLQQFNLSGIILYENIDNKNILNTCKPKNLKSNTHIQTIFDEMIVNFDQIKIDFFDKNMPYSKQEDQYFYYIYQLEKFGFLMFLKHGEPIDTMIHKALHAVNIKLTHSLIAANNIKELREKDKAMFQQSRLAQMGEMISMIAHQWRQPLTAISAASGTLILRSQLDKLDNDSVEELAHKIAEYTQHLSTTIDDFRDFFKPDKEKRETSYKELIDSVLNIVETSIKTRNIELQIKIQNKITLYSYDKELKQVLLNLIKNAEDVLKEKAIENPAITIEADGYILRVKDNAGGVPENIIDKVFNPYFSTKSLNGTGLGLYMSKTIVEEHCGGKLSVYNDAEGAVFEIELPNGEKDEKDNNR